MNLTKEQKDMMWELIKPVTEGNRQEIENADYSKYLQDVANLGARAFLIVTLEKLGQLGLTIPSLLDLIK